MLNQLENYYRTQGILATHFTCPHRMQCKEGYNDKFTGPKSALVSTGYEDGELPRLLIVSSDSGSGKIDPEQRLPSAVRDRMEGEDVYKLKKREHWYLTHELAWHILKRFNKNLEFGKTKHYFAHANAAKCSQNKPGRSQADPILFRNCQRYLAGEIRMLCPDIVVTQGKRAREGLKPIVDGREEIDKFACVTSFDSRPLFWLHTHHPSPRNRRRFYPQRDRNPETGMTGHCEGWQYYAKHIREFIDRTKHNRR